MDQENMVYNEGMCRVILNEMQSIFLRLIKKSGSYCIEERKTIYNINDRTEENRSCGYINNSIKANSGVVGYSYEGQKKVRIEDKNKIREFFKKYKGKELRDWKWYNPGGEREKKGEEYIVITDFELAKRVFGIQEKNEIVEEPQLEEDNKSYRRFKIIEKDLGLMGIAYVYVPEDIDLPDKLVFEVIN